MELLVRSILSSNFTGYFTFHSPVNKIAFTTCLQLIVSESYFPLSFWLTRGSLGKASLNLVLHPTSSYSNVNTLLHLKTSYIFKCIKSRLWILQHIEPRNFDVIDLQKWPNWRMVVIWQNPRRIQCGICWYGAPSPPANVTPGFWTFVICILYFQPKL